MNQADFQAKVLEHMGSTDAKLDNINGWMGKLDDKVDHLQTKGCAKGDANERRIDKVEKAPSKNAVIGGTAAGGGIAALLYGAFQFFEFVLGK